MTNEENWNIFIKELESYIDEHHHCPNKHTTLYNTTRYYRRKMKSGALPADKVNQLEEILSKRDFTEHTGGRRKKTERGNSLFDGESC